MTKVSDLTAEELATVYVEHLEADAKKCRFPEAYLIGCLRSQLARSVEISDEVRRLIELVLPKEVEK